VILFNFFNDKIRKLYQVGGSGTALHETMLHYRNLWPDDWRNFIANHPLKNFHRQNGYHPIATDTFLAILEKWNDKRFFPNSRTNAGR
jgi:hypothetical protein